MQALLLLFAILALLVALAWRRRRSTPTEVAGDQVALQTLHYETREAFGREFAALREYLAEYAAELAEVKDEQARLGAIGDGTAREMKVITQVLKLSLAADMRSSEQEGPASVCSTGGHFIRHRVR